MTIFGWFKRRWPFRRKLDIDYINNVSFDMEGRWPREGWFTENDINKRREMIEQINREFPEFKRARDEYYEGTNLPQPWLSRYWNRGRK